MVFAQGISPKSVFASELTKKRNKFPIIQKIKIKNKPAPLLKTRSTQSDETPSLKTFLQLIRLSVSSHRNIKEKSIKPFTDDTSLPP